MSEPFSLEDKYERRSGRIALTGLQALVRLPLEQCRIDRAAGLRVGTFICGYQGSPLGEYDKQLGRAARLLGEHDVYWQPGINEEVAATALYGAQLLDHFPHARFDGVTSLWYGKSPGVDRTGDAFRHGNFMGTGRNGAAVALAGDDTACKSSTIPGDSTIAFYDLQFPLLYPGDTVEILELGLHAIALSRFCGSWSALKIVNNVADGGGVVEIGPRPLPLLPEVTIDGRRFEKRQDHRLIAPHSVELERQMFYERSVAALAYVRENRLDRCQLQGPSDRVGLVAAGKSWVDLRHALDRLGLGEGELRGAGIRLYKLALVAPLEPQGLREFAKGLREIVVVEEKRGFIETQLRDALYGMPSPPEIFGKRDAQGGILFPAHSELGADGIALALAEHLASRLDWPELRARSVPLRALAERDPEPLAVRTPYFCSGCPHNRSTRLPEGEEQVGGGIGCHAMASWMDRGVSWLPQMGGEGACWIGLSPFTEKRHLFQNLGDGTFAHSGSKAVEGCIAAGVDITFRILFNQAVAMTGGQEVVGLGTPAALAFQLEAQGAKRVVIVSEQPEGYRKSRLSPRIQVRPRGDYEAVMRELRELSGVTVIIYDQQCAAEKRRERKRGQQAVPRQRVYINQSVCEGCGDCGSRSNCLSVVPVETALGRKTRIHQGSCNFDYTCLEGDCPAFMTLELSAGTVAARRRASWELPEHFPEPPARSGNADPYKVMLIGIGGTGVVTVDALLATAALLDGKYALHLDQTGLSQKGGAVLSNFLVSDTPIAHSNKIGAGEADLLLAFDLVASVAPDNLRRFAPERTRVVANTARTPTSESVTDVTAEVPSLHGFRECLEAHAMAEGGHWVDAEASCDALFGNGASANVFLLGAAYQAGYLPIAADAIESAIRANDVSVEQNLAAFRWGRRSVSEPEVLAALLAEENVGASETPRERLRRCGPEQLDAHERLMAIAPADEGLRDILSLRLAELLLFQGEPTAREYLEFVLEVFRREVEQAPGCNGLAERVAEGLYRLTALKDEYEVARLWLHDSLYERVTGEFEGAVERRVHLHPPLLRRMGLAGKLRLGPWAMGLFRFLHAMRGLRGRWLDPFGHTVHRRFERSLRPWYRRVLERALPQLTLENHALLLELAGLADGIRGYEALKEHNAGVARLEAERLIEKLETSHEDAPG